MTHAAAITFDADWAPDWCLRLCFDLCREAGVGATFFATNPSPVLAEIAADPRFEVGIHPNFFSNTTQLPEKLSLQEKTQLRADDMARIQAVLAYCLGFAPQARSLRTHGLWQCSRLFAYIEEHVAQLKYNVSLFLLQAHLVPPWRVSYADGVSRPLLHIPYGWEDDMWFLNADTLCDQPSPGGIYNFHPIHVALNSCDNTQYFALKKAFPDLSAVTPQNIVPFQNTRCTGSQNILRRCLQKLPAAQTISSLAECL